MLYIVLVETSFVYVYRMFCQIIVQRHNMLRRTQLLLTACTEPLTDADRTVLDTNAFRESVCDFDVGDEFG